MRDIQIVFHKYAVAQDKLVESGQSMPLKFCWLQKLDKNTFESQTPWMLCRDYFNEIFVKLYSGGKNNPSEIYGFKINNLDVRGEDKEFFYLGIKFDESGKYTPKLDAFLMYMPTWNNLEEMNGFVPTKVIGVSKTYLIVKCSRQWLDNMPLLSILTSTLRWMFYPAKDYTVHPADNLDNSQGWGTDHNLCRNNAISDIFYNFNIWSNMENKTLSVSNSCLLEKTDAVKYLIHDVSGWKSFDSYRVIGSLKNTEYLDKWEQFRSSKQKVAA